ncbi:MAG: CDP-diacylglycerol--serine O-phosphatidyltransferase [Myxococcales bacterium]|jgi:CDP-diacylglycerol--serine O-phosphatidyltransferase|nr:CDP-diacylglycerol--serine O-phosphatidyltransferase [Myxococcales bacterium]
MFVLPNLFTVSSIFCGFYSMTLSVREEFSSAAIAIFFAVFFDCFDGRVARLTKTQSEFGVELDSLADVMSFGLAPALLVYFWKLQYLGTIGLLIAFTFATCGALRLARFNVLAHRKIPGSSKFFVGLPIPLGGGMLVALVLAHETHPMAFVDRHWNVAFAVLLLAGLMVSNVRYRTFKDMKFTRRTMGGFLVLLLTGVVLAVTVLRPPIVLVLYFCAYLAMGLIEGAFNVVRHRRPSPAAAPILSIPNGGEVVGDTACACATGDDQDDDGADEADGDAEDEGMSGEENSEDLL